MASPQLSIIIAVFSEVDSLTITMEQLFAYFSDIEIEIILVAHPASAQNCVDNGKRLAQNFPRVHFYIQEQLPGQGFAYRQGIKEAQGSFIMLMNADLETDPCDARPLYDTITQQNCDLVVASRWCKGAVFDAASYGYTKKVLNFLFQRLFGFIFHTHISDLSFCYKIARADIFKTLLWKGTQHEFALETTLVPIALGMDVKEIPARWYGRKEGVSHFKFWRTIRHVKLALRIAYYRLRGNLLKIYKAG